MNAQSTAKPKRAVTAKSGAKVAVSVAPRRIVAPLPGLAERFFYAYTVTIENEGAETVRLLSRRWRIDDGDMRPKRIEGEGVVGEQPSITPGESYTYTSWVGLHSPAGAMRGAYWFATASGRFSAAIPRFALRAEDNLH